MDEWVKVIQAILPGGIATSGIAGIYFYYRKIDAGIRAELRTTIAEQAKQLKELWDENRALRKELRGGDKPEEGDS